MKRTGYLVITVVLSAAMIILTAVPILAKNGATKVAAAIWAHNKLYDTVLTPTSFNAPPMHSVDNLYNFGMSGLEGQRSVSDAAPGDRYYNGGRWSVKMVVFTDAGKAIHDADGDGSVDFELTNAEAVLHHEVLGHLIIHDTEIYFECPLLPRRNR